MSKKFVHVPPYATACERYRWRNLQKAENWLNYTDAYYSQVITGAIGGSPDFPSPTTHGARREILVLVQLASMGARIRGDINSAFGVIPDAQHHLSACFNLCLVVKPTPIKKE